VTYRNRLTILTLACLTTTLLAACSSTSPEAGRPNTAPPTTAPTAVPTSTTPPNSSTPPSVAPDRPSTANGLTLAAAEVFVRYYSDLMNYASSSGDGAAMLRASDAGCENCKAYADFVKISNAANGLLTGDYREHITDVSELVRGQSGKVGGSASVKVGAYISRETPSATPIVSEATNYKREFALSPQGGNWVMYEMKLVEQ